MPKDKYNFRYATERERFYSDVKEAYKQLHASEKLSTEEKTALRFIMDIDTTRGKHYSQVTPEGAGKGAMRGFRTFIDLRNLKIFALGNRYPGVSTLGRYKTECRISYFKRKGSRIVGEKVFARFNICYAGPDANTC